jgi:outer membrane protein assembly factor BamD (BamD/ComL family)
VESSRASRDFAEAMDALSRGDFTGSARRLEGFAAAHPRDARAEEAAYLEAIALERAGRTAEARAAARRYLAAYPDGAHRAQARRLARD